MADSVEEAAVERRERLQALREAQILLNTPDEPEDEREDEDEDAGKQKSENNEEVKMKFRNYLPHDKQLQEGKLAPPQLPQFQDPAQLPLAPPDQTKEDPFLNIAPKKPNWDLRRDVQKKLDKAERRTQKAKRILMEQEQKRRRLAKDGEDQLD